MADDLPNRPNRSIQKEWITPVLKKLPIAATGSKPVFNEGKGKGKGESGDISAS
jgi:hypothetical protein